MMKKHIYVYILMLVSGQFLHPIMMAIPNSDTTVMAAEGEEQEPIELEGKFSPTGLRSGGNTLEAEVQGNVIVATFHRNLGNVLVRITNDMGDTVYESTVNTSMQPQVFIPISGLSSGIYTIAFSNNLGAMYGDFEI